MPRMGQVMHALAQLCGVPAAKIELADRSLSHGTVSLDPTPGRERACSSNTC